MTRRDFFASGGEALGLAVVSATIGPLSWQTLAFTGAILFAAGIVVHVVRSMRSRESP